MNNHNCHIIANPAAGGGRTGRLLGTLNGLLQTSFGPNATLFVTRKPGDALESAKQAVIDGFRTIVIIGGDGTIHECVNGIYSLPPFITESVTLAIISTGTGCGLARSLGIPLEPESQIAIARAPNTRPIDLGRVHFTQNPRVRYFVNECQLGIGAEVVRETKNRKKALGGSLAYTLATLPLLFTYPNPEVEIQFEENTRISLPVTGISIGNGAITGGGMRLTPRAVLDDGLLDILVMKGQSPLQRAASFARVRSGDHILSPRFSYQQVRCARISSQTDLPVTADGEIVGALPATFETQTHAIRIHCPVQTGREDFHEHAHGQTEEIGV